MESYKKVHKQKLKKYKTTKMQEYTHTVQ